MSLTAHIKSRFRFAGDLARAADVARVLVKYGLAGWLAGVDWEPLQRAFQSESGEALRGLSLEERIRLVLTDLGTTFIKLGQMLSTRPDTIGQALATELSKLQAGTPADSPEVATRVLVGELGRPVEECFRKFDGAALASASIGQVHMAALKAGRRVVVKLQHPGIEGIIRRDLDILRFLAELAEKNEHLRRYQPVALIREFSRTTLYELDFRREQRNLVTFRRCFAEDASVVFPKPYPQFTTGRVLTMEHLKGVPVSDIARLDRMKIDRSELARRGANVFVQMIFRDGFYHADPHPGNLLALPGGRLGIIDAGMVGRIDDVLQRQIEDTLLAAGDLDAARLTDSVIRMCGAPEGIDRPALSADLTELFVEYGTQSVGEFNVSGALTAVSGILHRYKLALPGKLSMLIKCLIVLEGTGRLLSPSFSLAELLEPWRKRFLMERLSPEAQMKNARRLLADWERMAELIPKGVSNVMERLENGRFSVRLEHRHLKSAANRITVGLFISALLLASSVLMAEKVGPTVRGCSLIGGLGYVIAVLFGARMMFINRDGKVARKQGDWD